MDKIYTRHRFRIPKVKGIIGKTQKRAFKLIFNLILIIIVIIMIFRAIQPVFDNLCQEKAKSIATIISNEQATAVMKDYSYNNIFEVEKDSEGNVNMIKSNIFTINEITSDIAVRIQNKINEKGREQIEIPIGSFTGSRLLAGSGPSVKLKISTIGNVETDLKSEFEAQGINQTLHRVYLQVKCDMVVVTPFRSTQSSIVNQVLLVENMIVGNIPDTYYNFEGTNQEDTALETMN